MGPFVLWLSLALGPLNTKKAATAFKESKWGLKLINLAQTLTEEKRIYGISRQG